MLSSTPDVSAETMRWLGHAEGNLSTLVRASLLHIGLTSHSVLVRDAAALSVGMLNDQIGVRLLRSAIERESNGELRSDMTQILEDLESGEYGKTSLQSQKA
jgi:hypothetical protein